MCFCNKSFCGTMTKEALPPERWFWHNEMILSSTTLRTNKFIEITYKAWMYFLKTVSPIWICTGLANISLILYLFRDSIPLEITRRVFLHQIGTNLPLLFNVLAMFVLVNVQLRCRSPETQVPMQKYRTKSVHF